MKNIAALIAGLLFGTGLASSGMTDTAKVLGFLDLTGDWMPQLAFVMGGAVFVALLSFHLIRKRTRPICDTQFHLPPNKAINSRLIVGATLFGIGWGIYGYCPGPALGALVYLKLNTFIFVGAMLAGMWLAHRFVR